MFSRLENKINYKFLNKKLLEQALTHKSFSDEKKSNAHNERLEFLGDSVISLVICDYLFKKYPEKDEGELSKIKSYIVSKKNLTLWAKKIELQNYIKSANLRNFEEKGNLSIIANCFEALIGAIYLDSNFETIKKILTSFLESEKEIFSDIDFKSKLQEYFQKKYKTLPKYEVLFTEGPEHEKVFVVSLSFDGKTLSVGRGKSKKEAEQKAAENAIKKLKI